MKTFHLVDYKGKFTIICDDLDELDYPVGKITLKGAIKDAEWRVADAMYYGVPAIITKNKTLNKVYNKFYERYLEASE